MQRFALLFLMVLLAGCSDLRFPGVYRIDILQGNFVSREMLQKLHPGMTRAQVRQILGPPVLDEPFTPERWYYLLDYNSGEGQHLRQRIVIHFDGKYFTHRSGEAVARLQTQIHNRRDRALEQQVHESKERIRETLDANTT